MDERLTRLLSLKEAAVQLADSASHLGKRARADLAESTGLSYEGVDFALKNCLEHQVSRSTLSGLVRTATPTQRSFVLLSANVFVATFRAIALALCQSSNVIVRPSRREPLMARLLHKASGGAFELNSELDVRAGDHLWAYASDETLLDLKSSLLPGVIFHGHGHGMGLAVFREPNESGYPALTQAAEGLAQDVIAFDQRGCLSPRLVLIEGSREFAESVCDALVSALDRWEKLVPRGKLSQEEQADALRFESTMTFVGSSAPAGRGLVHLDTRRDRILIPPTGRYLHVCVCVDALPLLESMGERITSVGFFNPGHMPGQLRDLIGERRFVALGEMQRPTFDGPVDKRVAFQSIVL